MPQRPPGNSPEPDCPNNDPPTPPHPTPLQAPSKKQQAELAALRDMYEAQLAQRDAHIKELQEQLAEANADRCRSRRQSQEAIRLEASKQEILAAGLREEVRRRADVKGELAAYKLAYGKIYALLAQVSACAGWREALLRLACAP